MTQQKNLHALVALGTTSALALSAGVANAGADVYVGLSAGVAGGDIPVPADGDIDNYGLSGGVMGVFAGISTTTANGMMVGAELAWSGNTEGDPNGESSYDYAYDVLWTLDAKLRVGANLGNVTVYGFGGLSTGRAANYWIADGYTFHGTNIGVGAEMPVGENFIVGIEAISRDVQGYVSSGNDMRSSHQAINLRASFRF